MIMFVLAQICTLQGIWKLLVLALMSVDPKDVVRACALVELSLHTPEGLLCVLEAQGQSLPSPNTPSLVTMPTGTV